MRFLLKVFSLPLVAALSITVAVFSFLLACAGSVLKFFSFLVFLLGAMVALMQSTAAGGLILLAAFFISPFGLPMLANWLLDRLADLNFALRDFIAG